MQHIQTLGQKLVAKTPELADYACNVFADKIAMLDIVIDTLNPETDSKKLIGLLRLTREHIKRKGEALWIMHADTLTNLGLKVGKTGIKELSGTKSNGDTTS